ncbi:MAG TPA: S46 family peptidase [Kofleriaceae bacterium]|nr:S46 family peptidase [Kofleriaceae bacterium]
MKRSLFFSTLLLAAACGGGGTKSTNTGGGGGGGDVAGGGDTTGGGGGAGGSATTDPALAARMKFNNSGGMWMPRQMAHPQHAAQLQAMGVTLPAENLTNPLAEPLNAVVSLGGCTGSFVSPEGLVITNHHCVQGALQFNSTPDNDLVENGFLAKTKTEEKSAGPAAKISVAQAFTDVTKDVMGGLDAITDFNKRKLEIDKRTKALTSACEKGRPGLRCDVKNFYNGAEWQLIEYLEIRDVRLVYVPARAIGNYGGEIDNWAWPRHTGDWSFYRAYVGKDGLPADYSTDNVPFQPKHFLKVAQDGSRQHDFVMLAGYPGKTNRVTTYDETAFDVSWAYPYLIANLQQKYDLLAEMLKPDSNVGAGTKLKAGVAKQGVQNGLEKYQGVLAGLQKGDIMAQKKAIDGKVRAWAAKPGNEAFATSIARYDEMNKEEEATARVDFDRGQALYGSAHLKNAFLFVRMAEERQKKDADRKPGYQDRDLPRIEGGQKQFTRQFDATLDRAMFRLALVRAMALPEADRPWLNTIVGVKKGGTIDEAAIDKALDGLYKTTKLEDEATRLDLLKKASPAKLKGSKDPFIKLAIALWPTVKAQEKKDDARAGEGVLLSAKYAEAMTQALDGYLSPDANSTLRVTYGTIKPFKPGEKPFTVMSEILAKDTGEEPFDAPKKQLEAIKAKNWGPYADPVLGEVPVDFIADLDITGGNSGSAALNEKGELIGLAFDGNTEGLASDVVFNHSNTRTIIVDIRYALWTMDLLDGADNVLEEMGVKPSL